MYPVDNSKASARPRVISGHSLVHRRLNACRRAAIAAQVIEGEVTIELTARQAAQLLGASMPYVSVVRRLSPAMRQEIADGTDLTPFAVLLQAPSKPLALPKPVSDVQLADIIRHAGLERTLAVACEVECAAAD